MVENHNYNPHQKWKFRVSGQKYNIPAKKQAVLSNEDTLKTSEIINIYINTKGALIPLLQTTNAHFNYLPEPVLKNISLNLKMPLSNVYGVATFYNAFSLVPKGKYVINICTGTACHVKGSFNLLSTLETTLGIKMGETTEDMLFTLLGVRCLGCCGIAPVMKINEDIHGFVDRKKSVELIEKIKSGITTSI
ncbi:NAD(P)H-dependent oxidoreductase subunit E [Candidatus Desantisbacteria bacterium]|nr:NAD(P)H-dependent oxidoreductase subunit E [Candidatus Desantisbacteria bacterium]